ncbi:hypothetical protein [Kibdelosporangium aridum]|uniref:Uncharacterized protein n=1 Tax=Kibdelosporangium aridum TaxID=2030 RepID=A0A1W2DNK8_KIBAR|nr:hypothetical protein [Kibdelosporangium aridum]SMC99009.1 hypothetical protein SAMN05661093_03625 [Kibdelosporangium aridum]
MKIRLEGTAPEILTVLAAVTNVSEMGEATVMLRRVDAEVNVRPDPRFLSYPWPDKQGDVTRHDDHDTNPIG